MSRLAADPQLSCFVRRKIAPVTVLVRPRQRPLLLAKYSSVIADPVQVHVVRGTESRAQGPPLDGSVRVRSCLAPPRHFGVQAARVMFMGHRPKAAKLMMGALP